MSDDKKPTDLVTHNSIAETLVCSICQVRWEDSSNSLKELLELIDL